MDDSTLHKASRSHHTGKGIEGKHNVERDAKRVMNLNAESRTWHGNLSLHLRLALRAATSEAGATASTTAQQILMPFASFIAINSRTYDPSNSSVWSLGLPILGPLISDARDMFKNLSDYSDDEYIFLYVQSR